MSEETISLWALFSSAFISSTLLPGSSELMLVYFVNNSTVSLSLLLAVATTGNTLGGFSTYWLGRFFAWRFPNKKLRTEHQVAISRIQRWKPITSVFMGTSGGRSIMRRCRLSQTKSITGRTAIGHWQNGALPVYHLGSISGRGPVTRIPFNRSIRTANPKLPKIPAFKAEILVLIYYCRTISLHAGMR